MMRVLIIVNQNFTGLAIQRYIKYLFEFKSSIINFSGLIDNGTAPYLNYDIIVSDIYNESMINYGLQYGPLFEANNKKVIYFFTVNTVQYLR